MEADGETLGLGEHAFGKTLVDSGTTYSYFPPAVFAAWRKLLARYCVASLRV
ncbi:radial spoke 3 protein, putative [Eimeria tenella]|uniref:Radial spoke 3 protein, putative n=1 Tax=Eimeria tenella TaxID=5802 RepID=U6L434_EIMTE|nr:radial spoke 3 protein, putative [Eimeria tenella]CDJ43948.1 radial spoke 3 protein, putative [Eimeria tenella]|eukprot:XP_013234697.1 radial spoke 3 protein, putative [Eimeria tenella]